MPLADWAGFQLSFLVGLFCKEFMVTLVPLLLLFEILETRRFPKANAVRDDIRAFAASIRSVRGLQNSCHWRLYVRVSIPVLAF